jgi:hypothetical protein
MFEQVAAQQRRRLQPGQAQHIGRIRQIRLNIDPRPGAHVDKDDVDAAGPQRIERLVGPPRVPRRRRYQG